MIENLTAIVPFYNGHAIIERLLQSLPFDLPILVIDDVSDMYYESTRANVEVIRLDQKGYFAGAVNRGIQATDTDVLVLNQDTWFDSHAFLETIEFLRRDYAFFGERIRGDHPAFGNLGYVHGTCMFMRRDAIRAVGLLDEKNYPLWGNTAEYQWRVARKNFNVLPLKEIKDFHHERPTTERFGSGIKNLLEREPQKKDLLVRTPPLVSVVVPCHNYGRYLRDCVNSLIGGPTSLGAMPGQTLQSLEIVIVDDASTDNSLDYIREVTDISKGIRAYHLEKNVGTARALNYAIERTYGKYITFLSADDMREPDSLEKLVAVCEQNPHSFAYDDIWLFHTHKRLKQWPMEEYDFEQLIWKNHVHAGILYPREAWVETGGYPPQMHDGREDWAFNIALGIKGWCGVRVKNFGYLYRREGQNRTERNTTETHRENFLAKIMGLFPDIYKGNRPMACCGKGSNTRKNVGITSKVSTIQTRSALVAENAMAPIGSMGMELLEYQGGQMNFTISGDVTNAKYTFGKDRPRGWVDKRDVGTRDGKTGFLSKRGPDGTWLYRIANETPEPAPEPVEINEVEAESPVAVSDSETPLGGAVALKATLHPVSLPVDTEPVTAPNPTDLTVEEIKALLDQNLTREQWEKIYTQEMAGRNRKGAVAFIEEVLATWSNDAAAAVG